MKAFLTTKLLARGFFKCYLVFSKLLINYDRDIFYKDPALFAKQEVVDYIVDDIAYSIGVPRAMLNVVRTPSCVASVFHKLMLLSDCYSQRPSCRCHVGSQHRGC